MNETQQAISGRIPDEVIADAAARDIRQLAAMRVELSTVSKDELQGPCPLCGGEDRFYVQASYFGCRKCKKLTNGAINFVSWVDGIPFREAVAKLTNNKFAEASVKRAPTATTSTAKGDWDYRSDSWQEKAGKAWRRANKMLLDLPEGKAGREYLRSRGIDDLTWLAFRLGYSPAVSVPGTEGKEKAAAISIPWFVGGKLRGIRYRFLEQQRKDKQTAHIGSRFAKYLYGGHVLSTHLRNRSSLVIVEGEINAMSIWQVAHTSKVDVLSLGSESQRLTQPMIDHANKYRAIILWLDANERAAKNAHLLPDAYTFHSPNGQDANDLLQAGKLGGTLAALRWKGEGDSEALLWDLWDAQNEIDGADIDDGTRAVMTALAGKLGKTL